MTRLQHTTKYSNKQISHLLSYVGKIVTCGKHSGIPVCCIKFYITDWMWIIHDGRSSTWRNYWNKMEAKRKESIHPRTKKVIYNFGYIPCPKCLNKRSFSKIKKCPKGSACGV